MQVGDRIGYFVLLERQPAHLSTRARWLVRCDCGVEKTVRASHLAAGLTKSCGCKTVAIIRAAITRHGHSGRHARTPEHIAWATMRARCGNPKNKSFADYGGRGILVCPRWEESFEAFLRDVGLRPSATHSIERIDNALGYDPGNVRWATRIEQNSNRRNNHKLTLHGETATIAEWARRSGVPEASIGRRLRAGWDVARAVTEQPHAEKRNRSART